MALSMEVYFPFFTGVKHSISIIFAAIKQVKTKKLGS